MNALPSFSFAYEADAEWEYPFSKILQIKRFLQRKVQNADLPESRQFMPVDSVASLSEQFQCSLDDVWTSLNELADLGIQFGYQAKTEPLLLVDTLMSDTDPHP